MHTAIAKLANTTNAQSTHTCVKGNRAAATQTRLDTNTVKPAKKYIFRLVRNHSWHQPARAVKRLGHLNPLPPG